MYQPAAFVETDRTMLDALIERDNFVTLITVRDGEPVMSQLPVLYRRDGDRIELRGHWARPNPQARHAGPATVVVHGPHAYVSPSWYPDKEAEARVPTWNYAVAHLKGALETFDDEASLAAIVDGLSRQHEGRVGQDWRFELQRDDHRVQLRGIIGFRFRVHDVALKFKLNQNHPVANRLAVATQLEQQPREASREIAHLMQAALMRARTSTED
ncbi:FMN-binding negative transcriptional regulator [Lysobacter tyrosinilyticus]